MANIKLNNKTYPIPDSKLATATGSFITHLGTIAGNGLKVVIGGVEYSVDAAKVAGAVAEIEAVLGGLNNPDTPEERLEGDGAEFYTLAPTALSFRSTAPLNELQEIQINGVTVDPSNYTLEEGSTIVTFPIDYLKTLNVGSYEVAVASESKTVKGDFSVKAPELNEHGFYYNVPYTGYVAAFDRTMSFILHKDGSIYLCVLADMYSSVEEGTFTNVGGTITCTFQSIGTVSLIESENGVELYCPDAATTFVLNSELVAADKDYFYIYCGDEDGYIAAALDREKTYFNTIRTTVWNKPTFGFASDAHRNSVNLSDIIIPDSVTVIGANAFQGCIGLTCVTLPASITNIAASAFADCANLNTIIFDGTTEQWDAVTKAPANVGAWNYGVPATYVQCADGQVSLV